MSAVIELEVPREILDSARITPAEAVVELAVALYAEGRLSLGKARELAQMPFWRFRQLLAVREITPHYDVADVEDDRTAVRDLGLALLLSATPRLSRTSLP
jgi:predicted HTH domain antitoxin